MEQRLNHTQLSDILMEFERLARQANVEGRIFDFFKEHKVDYDSYEECSYDKSRVRLLIAGQSDIGKNEVIKLLKRYNININRVDMILDYDDLKTYKWNSIQYSDKYSDIIIGPMGHKSVGNDGYSSVIARMETEEGWPNVIRAEANLSLKFSKNSLEEAILKTEFKQKELSSY